VAIEPAKRGVSIKPEVERSGIPRSLAGNAGAPGVGDSRWMIRNSQPFGYRTLRVLDFLPFVILGLRFRSTPETMKPGLPKSI